MTDNMRIWNQVCKTRPSTTKKVEFGRKFTAIDAYSQIQRATELFGPMGIGWGYAVEVLSDDTLFIAKLGLWYILDGKRSEPITVFGSAMKGEKKRDQDAPKKAVTDALTKALSYLGFNADVFLGLFDDNKYVTEQQRLERQGKGGTEGSDDTSDSQNKIEVAITENLEACTTVDQLALVWGSKVSGMINGIEDLALRKAVLAHATRLKDRLKRELAQ